MKYYVFNDLKTSKDFIVDAYTLIEAYEVAESCFEKPKFICEISYFEAELIGLDER